MNDLSTFDITAKWPAQHPDRIQLYSLPTPNGVKASIMLEETGLSYETVRVDVTMGENLEPGFLAISPLGKIPALIDHDAANAPRRVFGSGSPQATVVVRDPRVWTALSRGGKGLAESYVDGWWDSPDVTAVFAKTL